MRAISVILRKEANCTRPVLSQSSVKEKAFSGDNIPLPGNIDVISARLCRIVYVTHASSSLSSLSVTLGQNRWTGVNPIVFSSGWVAFKYMLAGQTR